jgi:hypothetical protein
METLTGVRVVHSYDTEERRVRCGVTEQSSSTKHSREVTCVACRGMLDRSRSQVSVRAVASVDPSGP